MIILASTSPTRQALLRNARIPFSVEAPRVDERDLAARNRTWTPQDMALRLAEAKAVEVSSRFPDALVIGADQVLDLAGCAFSKPASPHECREQLLKLRGKTHLLISGVALARQALPVWTWHDEARLTMRRFSDTFLDGYLQSIGEDCMTSVGGYKIEGPGLQLFETIEGSHFTIMGLPMLPLLHNLRNEGELPE